MTTFTDLAMALRAAVDAEFKESEHPRDEEGKFSDKGAGASAGEREKTEHTARQAREYGSVKEGRGGLSDYAESEVIPVVIDHFRNEIAALRKQQGVEDAPENKAGAPETSFYQKYFGKQGSREINSALRNPKKNPNLSEGHAPVSVAAHEKTAAAMSNEIDKHGVTLPEGTKVYRGLTGAAVKGLASLKEGDTFKDNGFLSTSASKEYASRFGGGKLGVVLVIEAGGQKVMPFPGELEMVLQRGQMFTVVSRGTGTVKRRGQTKTFTELRVRLG